mgnify:CR=1 FL=1
MDEKTKKNLAEGVKENVPSASEINVNVFGKRGVKMAPNIMVFQTFAYLAATKLQPASCKVLLLFFAHSAYENYVSMDVLTISEVSELSERQTSRALNELTKNGIITKVKHPSDRRRNDYFLNPYSCWKGHSKSRKKMLEAIPDNQLNLFGIQAPETKSREAEEIKSGKAYLGK